MQVEIKTVDNQGRILLPKDWPNRFLKDKKAIVVSKGNLVETRPSAKYDLSKNFDKVEVDLKSSLLDCHKVRRELRSA